MPTKRPRVVNATNPAYYQKAPPGFEGHECIEYAEHMPFCLGNAFKYIWRAEGKDGIEALDKALWYLKRATANHWIVNHTLPPNPRNDISTPHQGRALFHILCAATGGLDHLRHARKHLSRYKSQLKRKLTRVKPGKPAFKPSAALVAADHGEAFEDHGPRR